jgi:hypothetical protein
VGQEIIWRAGEGGGRGEGCSDGGGGDRDEYGGTSRAYGERGDGESEVTGAVRRAIANVAFFRLRLDRTAVQLIICPRTDISICIRQTTPFFAMD